MTDEHGCEMRDECVLYQHRERYNQGRIEIRIDQSYCDSVRESDLDKTGHCPIYDTSMEGVAALLEMAANSFEEVSKKLDGVNTGLDKCIALFKYRPETDK
ncbi:hypothetical protein GOV03_04640 [Candidatus Woesearchaeota archaeon]|nr:hypothetical protein [Candidatus Woesearchaeota archaeon]